MAHDPLFDFANELQDVLPLRWLSDEDAAELLAHLHVRLFAEREVVYHRHDPGADAFVVHRGLVKSVLHDGEGRELLLGLYGRGEFFGTLTLFSDEQATRESTVVASMPTTVLQVGRADTLRVLERNPRAMRFLYLRYIRMIRRLSRQVETYARLDARSRLADFLLELGHLPEQVHLSQDELASGICASARTVRRVLADFAARGLVSLEPRGVRVRDAERLREEIRPWLRAELRAEFFRDLGEVPFRDT